MTDVLVRSHGPSRTAGDESGPIRSSRPPTGRRHALWSQGPRSAHDLLVPGPRNAHRHFAISYPLGAQGRVSPASAGSPSAAAGPWPENTGCEADEAARQKACAHEGPPRPAPVDPLLPTSAGPRPASYRTAPRPRTCAAAGDPHQRPAVTDRRRQGLVRPARPERPDGDTDQTVAYGDQPAQHRKLFFSTDAGAEPGHPTRRHRRRRPTVTGSAGAGSPCSTPDMLERYLAGTSRPRAKSAGSATTHRGCTSPPDHVGGARQSTDTTCGSPCAESTGRVRSTPHPDTRNRAGGIDEPRLPRPRRPRALRPCDHLTMPDPGHRARRLAWRIRSSRKLAWYRCSRRRDGAPRSRAGSRAITFRTSRWRVPAER